MLIVETLTFTLGAYRVQQRPRPDNPGFAVYLVFRGTKLVGRQFSRPCESDCQWLERENGVYATESTFVRIEHTRGVYVFPKPKRGRPKKADAERELQEAITT